MSDCEQHRTIQSDSLRVHILLDEGNNLRAVSLPSGGWFDVGDDNTAAELRATVKMRYRKQTRGEKAWGCSHAHPRCVLELDGDSGSLQRPESTKTLVGVRDEDDDGELDAGVLGLIPCAGVLNSTTWRRCCRRRSKASFTVAEFDDEPYG